uniref:Uncharacterized protein n=1 Tax=Panagrolaimus sp. ES5 TaxID=591445 RepID=A0AC34G8Y3_9BILA
MSKSMIVFETDDGSIFPLSSTTATLIENNGNSPAAMSVGKHSPKLKRNQLRAIDIDFSGGSVPSSPARNLQGSYSARSESSDVYANYSALHLHKLSNFNNGHQQQQVRSPLTKVPLVIPKSMPQGGSSYSARSESSDVYANYSALHLHKLSNFNNGHQQQQVRSPLTKVPLVIPKSMPQGGSEMSLASSTGSYGMIASEERYEAEIRKLNYELENYRQTITSLTAKHDSYNQMIHMFDSRLQMLVRHVSKLNQKSQLKEEEVEKLKSQIEYLRSFSSCATIPDSSPYGKVGVEHGGEHLQRHPSMESVTSHRSSLSTSSKSSRLDKNG